LKLKANLRQRIIFWVQALITYSRRAFNAGFETIKR